MLNLAIPFVLLNAADAFLTFHLFRGEANPTNEQNPFMGTVIAHSGWVGLFGIKTLIVVGVLLIMFTIWKMDEKRGWQTGYLCLAMVFLAVLYQLVLVIWLG